MTADVFGDAPERPTARSTAVARPRRDAGAVSASPAAEAVNGQLFIVYGPTVTLVSAPTAEAIQCTAAAWNPADLSATLHEYFADRDLERSSRPPA